MGFQSNFAPVCRENHQKSRSEDIWRDSTKDNSQLTIKIPNRRIMSVIARSVLVFLVVASFPWIGSMVGCASDAVGSGAPQLRSLPSVDDLIFLPLLFRDMASQGLINPGDRAVLIGKADRQRVQLLKDMDLDLIAESDIQRLRSVPENSLDFVYLSALSFSLEAVGRKLKIGGIAAVRLATDPSAAFRVPLNFKVVYLRHFDATVVAMRKVRQDGGAALLSSERRRLLALPSFKRDFLASLEDALLEPPRPRHRKRRRPRYLPDLIGDSLAEYPRRVFIDVGPPGRISSGKGWFERNYPRRNQDFEIYEVETETLEGAAELEEGPAAAAAATMGMSEWLRSNVGKAEYVVMKAEAEVVEEILGSGALELVDELFMECSHDGQRRKEGEKWRRRRAYWECLALYGKLRDKGVAVHQWWG